MLNRKFQLLLDDHEEQNAFAEQWLSPKPQIFSDTTSHHLKLITTPGIKTKVNMTLLDIACDIFNSHTKKRHKVLVNANIPVALTSFPLVINYKYISISLEQ